MAEDKTAWLGKISGHVKEYDKNYSEYVRQHKLAEQQPIESNILLTREQMRRPWDVSRVLYTTLGGKARPITADDIVKFRQNVKALNKNFKDGITPRQVINLSSTNPLVYVSAANEINGGPPPKYRSDIDKARKEITMAVPVSAHKGVIRFLTNAGKDSKKTRHTVIVELLGWNAALGEVAGAKFNDIQTVKRAANRMRKGYIKFDCDCERHRYFFRYLASVGGFAYGKQQEEGYPKIRNPGLNGVACKHVLRVMAELESSNTCLNWLTKHLNNATEDTPRTATKQKDAEAALKSHKPTRIKDNDQRKREADKARETRQMKKDQEKVTPSKKRTTQRTKRAVPKPKRVYTAAEMQSFRETAAIGGISVEKLIKLIEMNR